MRLLIRSNGSMRQSKCGQCYSDDDTTASQVRSGDTSPCRWVLCAVHAYTAAYLDRLVMERWSGPPPTPGDEYILTMTNRQWKARFGHFEDWRIHH